MPDKEQINNEQEVIEKPKSKGGSKVKLIIFGVVGYFVIFGIVLAGVVYFMKPDPQFLVQSVAVIPQVQPQNIVATPVEEVQPEPETIVGYDLEGDFDIRDVVKDLRMMEERKNFRNRIERDSLAIVHANQVASIAVAKFEALKEEAAKIIGARPTETAVERGNERVEGQLQASSGRNAKSDADEFAEKLRSFKTMAKIYSSMKPKDAVKIMNKMESSMVVSLLTNMKDKKVAKILSAFNPAKAARISKELSVKLAQL